MVNCNEQTANVSYNSTMDYWAQDKNTVPCALWMENKEFDHEYVNISYEADSYKVGAQNSDLFVLPYVKVSE